jgi:L-lactate dehydrogenase complex protein LldF
MSDHTTHLDGAAFLTEENKGLFEPAPRFHNLTKTCDYSSKSNTAVAAGVPYFQQWRDAAHEIKKYSIANLDKLLVQFESNMKSRGAEVLFAQDSAEANQHVLDIARKHNVKSVVKSKSMVTEEMELNHVLEGEGIRPIETDLGEYIVQLAKQRPIHLVTPAMHFTAGEVGELFHNKLGEPYTAEHTALTAIARKHLRADYLAAGMGVSGCNFAVADPGTVVIIENEGNAGLSTATPPVHVVTVGVEKLIPKIDYLPLFLNLLGRSGTGQKLTTYTHLIRGPAEGKKLYVIFLDNGRTNVLQDPHAWQSLFCIRCGQAD